MPIIKIIGADIMEFNINDIATFENKIKKVIVDIEGLEISEDHVVVYFMGPRNHPVISVEIQVFSHTGSGKERPTSVMQQMSDAVCDSLVELCGGVKDKIIVQPFISNPEKTGLAEWEKSDFYYTANK
jgi:hypothetical protein